ncbi:hypothetical protein Cgig2_011539 [Carnegiea gigantea]|uniref:Uncharacterized protein n=1 Tax=Carnegiea gigantea TaxID=171969 RepID=A0A9Q1K434_9CARY|nr:hypothetical protein Cgig2_011539 [Carnegiea gigantea]
MGAVTVKGGVADFEGEKEGSDHALREDTGDNDGNVSLVGEGDVDLHSVDETGSSRRQLMGRRGYLMNGRSTNYLEQREGSGSVKRVGGEVFCIITFMRCLICVMKMWTRIASGYGCGFCADVSNRTVLSRTPYKVAWFIERYADDVQGLDEHA